MRLDECVFYEIIINLNILHLKDVGDESQLDIGYPETGRLASHQPGVLQLSRSLHGFELYPRQVGRDEQSVS